MTTFHKNARVKVIRCPVGCYNGAEGRVKTVDLSNRTPYLVKFDQRVDDNCMDMTEMWFRGCELEGI